MKIQFKQICSCADKFPNKSYKQHWQQRIIIPKQKYINMKKT